MNRKLANVEFRNSRFAATMASLVILSCHGPTTSTTTPSPLANIQPNTVNVVDASVPGDASAQGATEENAESSTEVISPDRPLTLAEAQAVPSRQHFQLAAWLWSHPEPCPPCPEGAQCEPCMPPHSSFGDRPQRCATHPCHSVYVDYYHNFDTADLGQLFVIVGRWETPNDVGHRFTAEAMTAVVGVDIEPSTAPVPPLALNRLSAPWQCETTGDCEARLHRFCPEGHGSAYCGESAFDRQTRLCTVSCNGPTVQ